MQPADASPAARWRTASNLALVALFLVVLWTPLVAQMLDTQTEPLTENRRPAPFPQIEVKWAGPLPYPRKRSVQAFPDGFEAYYNDHFGCRRPLIRCYNLAVIAGMMPGLAASSTGKPRPEAPALVGKNGWLFSTRDEDMETYRCARPFTREQLADWSRVLREREAWLAQRGIRYLFVVPPSKPAIYGEHLPRAIQRVSPTTRVEQLAAALKEHGAAELLLNLQPSVLAAKREYPQYPCFYRTDTHWNYLGGYFGYRGLMVALQRWYPDARPWELADFDIQSQEGPPLVLAELMDTAELFTDTHVTLEPRRQRQAKTVHASPATRHGIESSVSENPQAPLGHALVLHDSFMLNVQPLFNEHWRQVHYFWTRDFPYEQIERLRPEIVIQEMAEHILTLHAPANPTGMQLPAERLEWARRPAESLPR